VKFLLLPSAHHGIELVSAKHSYFVTAKSASVLFSNFFIYCCYVCTSVADFV